MSENNQWQIYMLRCNGGQIYTGVTLDLERRFEEHQSNGPKCAKYLRGKQPLSLIFHSSVADKSTALKAEIKVKKLTKAKKLGLITGEVSLEELLA